MVEYSILKDTQISRKTYIYIMYVASFSQVGQEFGQVGQWAMAKTKARWA